MEYYPAVKKKKKKKKEEKLYELIGSDFQDALLREKSKI